MAVAAMPIHPMGPMEAMLLMTPLSPPMALASRPVCAALVAADAPTLARSFPASPAASPTALMASAFFFAAAPAAANPPSVVAALSERSRAARVFIRPMFSYRAMLACLMSL